MYSAAHQPGGSRGRARGQARLLAAARRVNIRAMSKTRALQKVGGKAIEVAFDASRGIAMRARGRPAEILAYGAAAALVLVGGAVAAGLYFSIKGLKDSQTEPQATDLPV